MTGHLVGASDREMLEQVANDTLDEGLRRRARLLLLYDEGLLTHEVARDVGISHSRARYWKRQYQGRGMGIFCKGPPALSEEPEPDAPLEVPTQSSRPPFYDLARFAVETASQAGPDVQAADPLAEAGRKVWRYQLAHMLLHEPGTLLGEDSEELHDMRVATRRMRAAFAVFSKAFLPKALKKQLKGLRRTGRTLGKVRDLDVFIDKARGYQETLPEGQRPDLEPLLTAWGDAREAARQELVAYLQSSRYQTFKESFYEFVSTPGAGVPPSPAETPVPCLVREAVPALIYARLASVRAFDAILHQATLEQFHALRIEFKKLRYTLEYFREVLGQDVKAVINEIKGLQDHLGDLNDANVAVGILRDFLTRWDALQAQKPVAERHNPEPVLMYLAHQYAERQRLMLTFTDAWAHFNRPRLREKLAKAISVL
jgi:CHAD domain-containing protein